MNGSRLSLAVVSALGCLLVEAVVPAGAMAQALLVPNARAVPGELGFLMGGALTALASGGEALWFNPAGLALETGARLTVGGDALRLQSAVAGGPASETAELAPGSLAYAQVLGERRGYPRFVLGLGLAQTTDQRLPTRIEGTRPGSAASLPPGWSPPGGSIDANFPQGLTVTDSGDASGVLRILAPGVALGIAPADWVRVGIGLELERVTLSERADLATGYSAATSGGGTLSGQSQLGWRLAGEALRAVSSWGVQLDLSPSWLLGLALRLPSEHLRGAGRIRYQRSDALTQDSGGTPVSGSDTVLVAHDGLPFRLESPRRVQLGLAYRSDRFLIEVDLYRTGAQAPYEALPASESQPPSTVPFVLPAVRTAGTAVLGGSVGMAYAQTERTSVLLSFASDPASVPPDDGLFRSVDVTTLSAGAYHVRGDLSVSIGVVYREARQAGVPVTPPDGGQPVPLDVNLRELAVQMGTSLAF